MEPGSEGQHAVELPHQRCGRQGVLELRDRADGRPRLRGRGDGGHARHRRHGQRGSPHHVPLLRHHPERARHHRQRHQAGRDPDAAGLDALQGGPGILGLERLPPAQRRHHQLVRRQLGQHERAAQSDGPVARRRLRHLLPLRLRGRRPQLQVGGRRASSPTPGSSSTSPTRTAWTGCGWRTSAT